MLAITVPFLEKFACVVAGKIIGLSRFNSASPGTFALPRIVIANSNRPRCFHSIWSRLQLKPADACTREEKGAIPFSGSRPIAAMTRPLLLAHAENSVDLLHTIRRLLQP